MRTILLVCSLLTCATLAQLQVSDNLQCKDLSLEPSVLEVGNDWKIQLNLNPTGGLHSIEGLTIEQVDIHFQIQRSMGNVEEEMNEIMRKESELKFVREMPLIPIRLNIGDCLRFSFTYVAKKADQKIACDSEKFLSCPVSDHQQSISIPLNNMGSIQSINQFGSISSQSQPSQLQNQNSIVLQCPAINFDHNVLPVEGNPNLHAIQFRALTTMNVVSVIVHWDIQRVNNAMEVNMNERMIPIAANLFERNMVSTLPIVLNLGDCILYSFTYCIDTELAAGGKIDCNTPTFTKCILPPPQTGRPHLQPPVYNYQVHQVPAPQAPAPQISVPQVPAYQVPVPQVHQTLPQAPTYQAPTYQPQVHNQQY